MYDWQAYNPFACQNRPCRSRCPWEPLRRCRRKTRGAIKGRRGGLRSCRRWSKMPRTNRRATPVRWVGGGGGSASGQLPRSHVMVTLGCRVCGRFEERRTMQGLSRHLWGGAVGCGAARDAHGPAMAQVPEGGGGQGSRRLSCRPSWDRDDTTGGVSAGTRSQA